MQIATIPKNPLHMANLYRAIVKEALREYRIPSAQKIIVPTLCRDMDYYFIYESVPKIKENKVVYGITCFDSEGVILFDYKGIYPVSLWRFRRQGPARTMQMMEGLVKQAFRRKNIPLSADEPFSPFDDGIYVCSINWTMYTQLLKTHIYV